jgi:hypothetical protein
MILTITIVLHKKPVQLRSLASSQLWRDQKRSWQLPKKNVTAAVHGPNQGYERNANFWALWRT